jgi:cyclophilin family peptidyl-prolyl cis-trans isomerase
VFGKVIEGENLLKTLEKVGTDSGSTKEVVKIVDCGEIKE